LPHPAYSPNFVPSGFSFFGYVQETLTDIDCSIVEELKSAIITIFTGNDKEPSSWSSGHEENDLKVISKTRSDTIINKRRIKNIVLDFDEKRGNRELLDFPLTKLGLKSERAGAVMPINRFIPNN
jgi:hypothetical protein